MLELLLIAVLAISLAHWTWALLAPRTVAASTLATYSEAQSGAPQVKRNLFGVVQEGKASAVVDASPTSRVKLLGILSGGVAGGGRAIFALESGKPKTVEAGSQVMPGLVLKEVYPDYVLVARSGLVERMKLDRRGVTKN